MSEKTAEDKWLSLLVPCNVVIVIVGLLLLTVFQNALVEWWGRAAIVLLFVGLFGMLFGYIALAQAGGGGFVIFVIVTGITAGITLAVLFVVGGVL